MRNGQLKPGINWLEIENRIRSGEKPYVVSKDFDISRQAIEKRARKLGWIRSQKAVEVAKHNAKVAKGEIKIATKDSATLMTKRNHVQRFAKPKARRHVLGCKISKKQEIVVTGKQIVGC
jgi:NAD-specific glutamate dehydrogenase